MKLKFILICVLGLAFYSCSKNIYTSQKYFSCIGPFQRFIDTYEKELIYNVLERAVVIEKDIPDYIIIKDKRRIYISSTFPENIRGETELSYITTKDIPRRIGDIRFSLKNDIELQEIADATEPFAFLVLGNIKIDGDTAIIGIEQWWQSQTNSKIVNRCRGGYILEYKKINNKWQYNRLIKKWKS